LGLLATSYCGDGPFKCNFIVPSTYDLLVTPAWHRTVRFLVSSSWHLQPLVIQCREILP
jgi:hypothetical protein